MHRLFVAVRPPRPIREKLIDSMGGISGARWQSDDQLHLTLRFIGEVEPPVAEDIHAALGTIHQPRFNVALSSLGTFDRRGQPEVVWAGVTPHEPLKALHKKVDQALAQAGLPREGRAYLPHITLARMNRSSGSAREFLEQAGGLSSDPFTVDSFFLYESELTPAGAVYSIIERYPLD